MLENCLSILGFTLDELLKHVRIMLTFELLRKAAMKGIKKLWKLARDYFTKRKRVSESQLLPFDVIMLVFVPQKDDLVLAAVVRLQLHR